MLHSPLCATCTRTFIIHFRNHCTMATMTREQFDAIPYQELFSSDCVSKLHEEAKRKILRFREYLAPPSRHIDFFQTINQMLRDMIKHERDLLYVEMVAKACRLTALHRSTQARRQLARERRALNKDHSGPDSDLDPDSDAETDKYVPTVQFQAINTHRTRSSTKKRTRVQRNLQI